MNTQTPAQQRPSHFESGTAEFILTGSDLLRDNPQLLRKYFKNYGLKPTFLEKLKALGFSRAVEGPITEHYEKQRPTHTLNIGTIITPPTDPKAGKDIVVALAASEMYTYTDSSGSTRYGSRPRKTEMWQFADRNNYRIIAKNTAVNPHQLTFRPKNANIDPTIAIVPGAKAFYVSTLAGEATGQPGPLTPRNFKYQNTFAIIKESDLVSGTAMTTAVAFTPVDGKPNYLYLEGLEDAEVRFERNKSYTMIHGQKANNLEDFSAPFDTDVNIPGTEGLIEFALTGGFDDEFTSLGAYTIDDFYALAGHYHELHISSDEIALMLGWKADQQIDKLLVDFLSDTYVSYVGKSYMGEAMLSSGLTAGEMFVTVGFKGLEVSGYKFLKMSLDELEDIEGAGAAGFDYNQWIISTPLGFFQNKKANESLPLMGYEWRGNTMGYSRENQIWKNGGSGPVQVVKSSEFDVMNSYFLCEIAPHFALSSQFVVQHPE